MEAIGLAGISGHFLQPLGEDRPFAPEVVAEKTADAKADANVEGYGYAMAGQVSYGAGVAAVCTRPDQWLNTGHAAQEAVELR